MINQNKMNTLQEILEEGGWDSLTKKKEEYPTAGWYSLEKLSIRYKTKPNFIKRFCMKYFLGFIWTDGTEEDWYDVSNPFKSE